MALIFLGSCLTEKKSTFLVFGVYFFIFLCNFCVIVVLLIIIVNGNPWQLLPLSLERGRVPDRRISMPCLFIDFLFNIIFKTVFYVMLHVYCLILCFFDICSSSVVSS